jgi:hypothetical protein
MIRRKTEKTTRKKTVKNEYQVDGKKYKSKILYDAHLEFADAVKHHLITSFELDDGISKKSRYTSYKPILDGIKFDSLMEARFFLYLKAKEKKGDIRCLELQPSFTLQESFTKNGKKYRPIAYVADFRYQVVDTDQWVIVDVKGKETVEFKLKQKLFEYKYPDLSLSVIQLYGDEWLTLTEIRKRKRSTKKS